MISRTSSPGETPMIRETTAADLPTILGPLLASLLVVLASLPAVETIRLRLARSVRGVRSSLRLQASLGLAPQCRAPLGRRLDESSPTLLLSLLDAARTGFTLPLLSARRLKARPS
jgi:hypothetical protein